MVVLAESLCLRLPGQHELCAAVMAHVVEGDAAREEGPHRWGAAGAAAHSAGAPRAPGGRRQCACHACCACALLTPAPLPRRRPITPVDEPHQRLTLASFIGGALQQLQRPQSSSSAPGQPPLTHSGPGAAGGFAGPRSLSTPEVLSGASSPTHALRAQAAEAALRHVHSMGSASDAGSSSRLEAGSTGSSAAAAAAAALQAGGMELGGPVQREWVLHCRPVREEQASWGGASGARAAQLEHRMYVQAAAGELRLAMALVHDRGI